MTVPNGTQGKMLTIDDVAELLNIKTRHVRHLVNNEGLPVIRLSTHVHRFDADEVLAWARSRQQVRVASE